MFLGGTETGIGCDVGEVEHCRAEAAIFPVDEPQPPAVIKEIRGKEVVMAEMMGSGTWAASSRSAAFIHPASNGRLR